NSGVIHEFYLASTGLISLCRETQQSKYNYTIPFVCTDILYMKNPRYWEQYRVNSQIFRSSERGALLGNGDLYNNSPMHTTHKAYK
ncbi:unnamed protein product, partial [Rotaria sp. Silwood1]